jgi:DHA1 family bicyclomycin/chloramphenicol resistance-like MFS transporter
MAPLLGSALIMPFGWRALFIAITLAALLCLVLVAALLPETRPAEDRITVSVADVIRGFGGLLLHRRFLGLTVIGALGMSSFFVFLASSSFVYIDHFGLTPTQYSIAFSINAIGFIGASQFAARLGSRFGMPRMVIAAVAVHALFALVLLALTVAGIDSLPVLIVLLFLSFAGQGLVIPSTMVLALEDHGPLAGLASALGGTLQMVAGGAMIVVASLIFDGTVLPMVAIITLCAVCALLLSIATLARTGTAARPRL